ncbi:unnamed protein product [Bursaphelenchus xylophilus]|uniref:(pine wood nematode) hypothetical protein n=1 Tax=Bursaphelenchus xylophilus TaxID=6326 RepID=A0A1I7RZE4_BURXY|nr:unnamed protein product [Bursaphelenchus xylophilus]CAG9106520.1 unnamed protein product [Bursaphelenchus xylophilus]
MASVRKSLLGQQNSTGNLPEQKADCLSVSTKTRAEPIYVCDLPWAPLRVFPIPSLDFNVLPARYSAQSLLLELFNIFEKKLAIACNDNENPINKTLRRIDDPYLDNILRTLHGVCEVCLPPVLSALIRWHEAQQKVPINENGEAQEKAMKRTLGASYLYCIALIEILPQLVFYKPEECEQLVNHILNTAFKQASYRDPDKFGVNIKNSLFVAEIFGEVIGVFSQTHFTLVHKMFSQHLDALRKESPFTNLTVQKIIALLMAMKFFRIKTNQIEDFEMGVKFLNEIGSYYLEVDAKQKELKHSLAGLLVEILLPVAGDIKTEANVPSLIAFVDKMYGPTYELVNKKQHRMTAYPLLTCLLCISQNKFFLSNWVQFLSLTLANLKNKDPKTARVALESLYRLLWVYSIRINCEGNSATRSRLESICFSLFPKGNRNVIPRESPVIIFVKIIHFIAYQKLDFAFKEIIFDLLGVNRLSSRSISIYPERMNIGLRALMVITDGLQQKDGPPGMPRATGPVPASGTIQRIKKTYITRPLTPDIARSIGLDQYYYPCRKAFDVILRTLDAQLGRPYLLTSTQTRGKESIDFQTGELKPKMDLFRTCIAAIPRLLPDPMTHTELIELLTRISIHVDDDLRTTAFQTLQHLVAESPDWREDIINAQLSFITNTIQDTFPSLIETTVRCLLQLLCTWKSSVLVEKKNMEGQKPNEPISPFTNRTNTKRQATSSQTTVTSSSIADSVHSPDETQGAQSTVSNCSDTGSPYNRIHLLNQSLVIANPTAAAIHNVEGFALVLLCQLRAQAKKMSIQLLKECRHLLQIVNIEIHDKPMINVLDESTSYVLNKYFEYVPLNERQSWGTDFVSTCDRLSTLETDTYLVNSDKGNEYFKWDAWASALSGYCEYHLIPSQCPTAVAFAWPALFIRFNHCTQFVDPSNYETRASLLRSSKSKATASSMCGETIGQESYLNLWQKYLVVCCALCPPVNSVGNPRSFSPSVALDQDVIRSMSSSTRIVRPPTTNSAPLFVKICSMLRWEMSDMMDFVVLGVGSLSPMCFEYLLEEMTNRGILREAQEKKVRSRNKRRDLLRLQLLRILEVAVFRGLLVHGTLTDPQTGQLTNVLIKLIDSLRENVVSEVERDITVVTSLRLHFAKTLTLIVNTLPIDRRKNLLPDDLKRELVQTMFRWCGRTIATNERTTIMPEKEVGTFVEQQSVSALCALLCCGPIMNEKNDEDYSFRMLDALLVSTNQTVCNLFDDTLATILHLNDQSNSLFEWTVNMCYSKNSTVASKAFKALVLLFSRREFACDFVTLFVLCQVYALDSDSSVQTSAILLLQILRRQGLDYAFATEQNEQNILNDSGNHLTMGASAKLLADFADKTPNPDDIFPINYSTILQQLSETYPKVTMSIFSEICSRLENAKTNRQAAMLSILLHWITNIELVDPFCDFQDNEVNLEENERKTGWGSAEATQLLLNNLVYISVKYSAEHSVEIAALWKCLATSYGPNLNIIVHFLFVMMSLAPDFFIPVAKKIAEHLLNATGDQLITLLIEQLNNGGDTFRMNLVRSEIPPYFRWHNQINEEREEKEGTEDTVKEADLSNLSEATVTQKESHLNETNKVSDLNPDNSIPFSLDENKKNHVRQLPMPAYGGHYSSLAAFLPPTTQPITYFSKSNLSLILLSELIGADHEKPVNWYQHTPTLLNIAVTSLDSLRSLVCRHSRLTILRLCLLNTKPSVNTWQVASLLLSNQVAARQTDLFDGFINPFIDGKTALSSTAETLEPFSDQKQEDYRRQLFFDNAIFSSSTELLLTLSSCLTDRMDRPLWAYEDISTRNWHIDSADQLGCFCRHIAEYFIDSIPKIAMEWTTIALKVALSTNNRHVAGRCFQIAGALCQSLAPFLSQILSRLTEIAGEYSEDVQAYLTHMLLCVHAGIPNIIEKSSNPISMDTELKALSPASSTHNRSISHTPGLLQRPQTAGLQSPDRRPVSPNQSPIHHPNLQNTKKDTRHSLLIENELVLDPIPTITRCKSAQMLASTSRGLKEEAVQALSQVVSMCVCLLESQIDNEYLLAVHLLKRIFDSTQSNAEEVIERFEGTIRQLNWKDFNGIVALSTKGVIYPSGYEDSVSILTRSIEFLDYPAIGNKQQVPLIIISTLPYCLLHFDSPTETSILLCRQIAAYSTKMMIQDEAKDVTEHPLQNLITMVNQYCESQFARDRLQWAKCVINYMIDGFKPDLTELVVYLTECLEKCQVALHFYILNLIHLVITHGDWTNASPLPLNAHVIRVVTKHLQSVNWREAGRILKAILDQWNSISVNAINDVEVNTEQRKPDFDIYIDRPPPSEPSIVSPQSPRKLAPQPSTGNADSLKRQQISSQTKVRERLVTLMTASGLPVGLPRSSSVIFSQSSSDIHHEDNTRPQNMPTRASNSQYSSSELISHQDELEAMSGSSMANAGNESMTTDSFPRVFKEFDFLEAEHDTISESNDSCFNYLSTMRPQHRMSNHIDTEEPENDGDNEDDFLNPNDDEEYEEDDDLEMSGSGLSSNITVSSRGNIVRQFGPKGRRRIQRAAQRVRRPLSGASDSNDVSSDRTPVQSVKHSDASLSSSDSSDDELEEDDDFPADSNPTFSYYNATHEPTLSVSTPHTRPISHQSPIETNSTTSFQIADDTTAMMETASSVQCRSEYSSSQQVSDTMLSRQCKFYLECNHHISGLNERQWLSLSAEVIGDQNGDLTANSILIFSQILRENCVRLSSLLRDASHMLSSNITVSTDRPVRDVSVYFNHALNAILKLGEFPFIFTTPHFLRATNLLQSQQDMIYFLHQHFETFMEKREQCIRALNQMRASLKLQTLGSQKENINNQEMELCKCFERLFFQLLSILERFKGIIGLIKSSPNSDEFDLSPAVSRLHHDLLESVSDVPLGDTRTSTTSLNVPLNEQLIDKLFLHLTNKNFRNALITLRQLRSQYGSEFGCCDHMDVDVLLVQFCRSHRLRTWALIGSLDSLNQGSDHLKETNMQMSALVRSMERETSVRSSRVGSVTEPFQ